MLMAGHLSNFLQCKMNIFLFRMLGWSIARWMVFMLGKLHFLVNFQDRIRITQAVHHAVGKHLPDQKFSKLLSRTFDGILSHYYEKLYIAFEEVPKATRFLKKAVTPDGLQMLRDKIKKGKGVIVVT
jgi:Kdo2-lipid IVA lauroyltransferase/acyltransferase